MAAAANDEAPILVRNDPIMYRFLQNQKNKFKITIDITSAEKIYAKYEICLFMYNIKSKDRNPCHSLRNNYHSSKKGTDCAYIGFIDKNLSKEVHNEFFYKSLKTTWFLDYNVINPKINIEDIKEDKYSTRLNINIESNNQVKKIIQHVNKIIK